MHMHAVIWFSDQCYKVILFPSCRWRKRLTYINWHIPSFDSLWMTESTWNSICFPGIFILCHTPDPAGMRRSDLLFLLRYEDKLPGSLNCFDHWLSGTVIFQCSEWLRFKYRPSLSGLKERKILVSFTEDIAQTSLGTILWLNTVSY